MEVLHPQCCGLDVHKETVAACLRLVVNGKVVKEVRTFATTTASLMGIGVAPAKQVHACRHGGDRRLLETRLAHLVRR
jgi:hypothetical protein